MVILSNPENADLGIMDYAIFYPNVRMPASISAEAIDQDAPTNTTWVQAPPVVYGGSIPSTADNLRLTAIGADGMGPETRSRATLPFGILATSNPSRARSYSHVPPLTLREK
jgi:hypothetical protein